MSKMDFHLTSPEETSAEVLGFSLNIAIETLSEIDRLGKNFLNDLGLTSLDPGSFYPYHYRLRFFNEINLRLGWPGLFMLGAKIPEHVENVLAKRGTPSNYIKVIQPFSDELKNSYSSRGETDIRSALKNLVILHNQELSNDAQRGLRGKDAISIWSHEEEPASDGEISRFLLKNVSLSDLEFEAVLRGNCINCFRRIFPDGIDFSFVYVPELSLNSGLHRHCVFRLTFKEMDADVSHKALWAIELEKTQKELYKKTLDFAFDQEKLVKEKMQKIQDLMLNVLPPKIAARLEAGEKSIADSCPNATILFSDIVGFTAMSAAKSAEELVNLLNDLFSKFDRRALSLGLEKIKTIGDAYMVAGGLTSDDEQDTIRVIQMALGMLDDLKELNLKYGMALGLRIGVNTGPVVAGVIGESKFSYDLWGNTVNIASRMESTSAPGKIQISPSTYAQVRDHFDVQERELIECKGLGKIMTYFVHGSFKKPILGNRPLEPKG